MVHWSTGPLVRWSNWSTGVHLGLWESLQVTQQVVAAKMSLKKTPLWRFDISSFSVEQSWAVVSLKRLLEWIVQLLVIIVSASQGWPRRSTARTMKSLPEEKVELIPDQNSGPLWMFRHSRPSFNSQKNLNAFWRKTYSSTWVASPAMSGILSLLRTLPIFLSQGRRSNDSIDNFIYMTPLYTMKTWHKVVYRYILIYKCIHVYKNHF